VAEALKRSPGSGSLHALLAGIAWNQNDTPTMESELKAAESSGGEGEFSASDACIARCAHGKARQTESR